MKTIFSVLFVGVVANLALAKTVYVNQKAMGNNSGSSWANA
jgi:hypothetical protein